MQFFIFPGQVGRNRVPACLVEAGRVYLCLAAGYTAWSHIWQVTLRSSANGFPQRTIRRF